MALSLGTGVEVICISNNGLWALNKPAGVLSHPNKPGEEDRALINAPYDTKEEAYQTDEGPYYLLHRLDGPTSGVILVTPRRQLALQVKELLRSRQVKKVYHAIVAGKPRKPKELWTDKLQKTFDRESGGVRGRAIGGGARAETQMTLLKTFPPIKEIQGKAAAGVGAAGPLKKSPSLGKGQGEGIVTSLLELRPLTGRTHQLRIQCARRQMPILGDGTYGDFKLNRALKAKELFLHASRIEIPSLKFFAEAELPRRFAGF